MQHSTIWAICFNSVVYFLCKREKKEPFNSFQKRAHLIVPGHCLVTFSHSTAFHHISFVYLVLLIYPWAVARSLFSIPNNMKANVPMAAAHDALPLFISSQLLSTRVPV